MSRCRYKNCSEDARHEVHIYGRTRYRCQPHAAEEMERAVRDPNAYRWPIWSKPISFPFSSSSQQG